jgi:hypothetical protein
MSGPETVECANCGKEIRLTAEVCHNCGTDNLQKPGRTISTSHDPSKIETTVSETWYYGIAGGTGLWIIGVLMAGVADSVSGSIMLIAWIVLPISAYFDMQYIRANSKWNPNTVLWLIGLAFPLLNIFLGGAYLYRRHETIGVV